MGSLVSPSEGKQFHFGKAGSSAAIVDGTRFGFRDFSLMLGDVQPGDRVPLHRHAYDEVFVVQAGHGRYTIGDEIVEADAGQIVVVPAGIPHTFTNPGTEPLHHLAVHGAPEVVIEWLEPLS
jgi:mannose-6-phosphate isomerase-like protein (cupin superfamily)